MMADILDEEGHESGVIEAEIVTDAGELHGLALPCPSCGAPRESSASSFCTACGTPLETPNSSIAAPVGQTVGDLPTRTFECDNCGTQVATSVEQRSYVCPFCDSPYVTEIPIERSGRQRPEFIIGFAVTADDAKEKFFKWLGQNAWFRPGDLKVKAVSEKQKGVYLPFWHFSTHASSRWSASIGEHWYRTETYRTKDSNGRTVTRTRRVQETEWFPLRGQHRKFYSGFLVPASQGITTAEAHRLQPFRLSALTRYRPFFLAGWMAEEYSVGMETAIERTETEFRRRQQDAIRKFLPGDTHRDLSTQTEFEVTGSDLLLMPVHVLSYRYRDKVFRFLVNGQTGKVYGEKPWSRKRVTLLVLLIAAIIIAAVIAIVLLGNV